MPDGNGIQSVPSLSVRPQVTIGGRGVRRSESPSAGLAGDVYSGGHEAWRNRATTATGQVACRCGNCPACSVQEYASQGKRLSGEYSKESADPATVDKPGMTGQEQGKAMASGPKGVDGEELSQQELAELADLKKIDRAVRAHEQAHVAAAGGLVQRGVSLSYQKGPDGQRYAVAGEVSIDTSKEADPADTVAKMRTVRAAALAPADPSPQDRKVAAAATVTMNSAMHELTMQELSPQDSKKAVGQAAEKLAGRSTEDASVNNGTPSASPKNGTDTAASPARVSQRYMASATTLPKRLIGTA